MNLVIATSNKGKYRELVELLDLPGLEPRSIAEFAHLPPALEEGTTFAENARIKAEHYHRWLGLAVLADDSGLNVDVLNGDPGIRSARYAGPSATDKENIEKLLRELSGVARQRTNIPLPDLPQVAGYSLLSRARFVCALSLFVSGGEQFCGQGVCEGFVSAEPKGYNGFGYDPVFFIWQEGKTMAELPASKKNLISHRAKATRSLRVFLTDNVIMLGDR